METIRELADRLGTHKTGIRRTLKTLGLSEQLQKGEGGVLYVPEEVAEQVEHFTRNKRNTFQDTFQDTAEQAPEQAEQHRDTVPEQPEQTQNTGNTGEAAFVAAIAALTEQLKAKDQQIAAQQQTIDTLTGTVNQLTGALERAQQLHAGTIAERLEAGTAPDQTQEPAPEIVEAETMQEAPAEPDQEHTAPVEASEPETTPENVPSRAEPPKQDDTPAAKRGGILRAIFRRRG